MRAHAASQAVQRDARDETQTSGSLMRGSHLHTVSQPSHSTVKPSPRREIFRKQTLVIWFNGGFGAGGIYALWSTGQTYKPSRGTQAFSEIGWVLVTKKLVHNEYGGWTRRGRVYIIALSPERCNIDVERARHLLRAMAATCAKLSHVERASVDKFLLCRSHPYLKQELQRRQQDNSEQASEAKWPSDLAATLEKQGVRMSECDAPPEQKTAWYDAMPTRCKMHLGFCTITRPNDFCFDLNQTIGRAAVGNDEDRVYPTLVPNSFIWDTNLKRPLTGLECLSLQGFPVELLDPKKLKQCSISDTLLKDLAGNSFAGPCFMAALLSLLCHFPVEALENLTQAPDTVADGIIDGLLDL